MLRSGLVGIALAIIGCGGSHTLDDAGGPEGIDAATERADTGGEPAADAGTDASEANDAASDAAPVYVTNESTCVYVDYGSTCSVPCDLPPDVEIFLGVHWTGPYCCNLDPANTNEGFWGCRCVDGVVFCPDSGASGAMFRLPFSTCEFCPGTPSGMIPGSHGHDAGPDAFTSDAAAVAP
jgi:hypothetical protein